MTQQNDPLRKPNEIDRSYRVSLIVNTTSTTNADEDEVIAGVRQIAYSMLTDIVSDDDSLGLLDFEEVFD